ncbi:RNA-guided endonuclease TnpB family protein [Streptomyces mirabilis]|uniref:RNA-guided endonuclease TnpB family protein n=1 Tax=Streptomyces mirabilis TaxID=68239 RepID=UPI003673CF6C
MPDASDNARCKLVLTAGAGPRVAPPSPCQQHDRVTSSKASAQIIRDSQAVCVEDLAVSGLGRTRLAKPVQDAGWSAFVGMLECKAVRHGRTFARVDRAFPSSQVCSACGFRDGPKPLHVREWTCGACGTVHDRDHDAARNVLFEGRRIVAAGRAETPTASQSAGRTGTKVPAERVEAGSPRKGQTTQAGIPGLQAREHVKACGNSPRVVPPVPARPQGGRRPLSVSRWEALAALAIVDKADCARNELSRPHSSATADSSNEMACNSRQFGLRFRMLRWCGLRVPQFGGLYVAVDH